MKDYVTSVVTKRTYSPSDCIRLVNFRQFCFYLQHNVEVLDIYPSKDLKTGKDIVVYLVDKNDKHAKEVYEKWKKLRETENEQ